MNIEILLLSILYVLAFVAFIGAINARGVTKMAISFFLAIVCLSTAIFHTAQFYVTRIEKQAAVEAQEQIEYAEKEAEELAQQIEVENKSKTEKAVESEKPKNTRTKKYLTQASSLAQQSLQLSQSIEEIQLSGFELMTDSEYEALRNQAKGYLSTAMGLKNKLQELEPAPAEVKAAHQKLENGLQNLVTATSIH